MLTTEENEYLCRVGPGTPMGAMLRRFWVPACMSTELAEPDCPPVEVRLFGERFVAFRDSSGQVGVLDEACTHRGASLALGRVEDCGIRCLYHGWKFDVDGVIQETPNMPDSRFKERVRAPAYPVREAAGLIWTYLGPPEKIPPFPEYNWMGVPDDHRAISWRILGCNFVQAIEGVIDSSHVGLLHHDEMAVAREDEGLRRTNLGSDGYPTADDAPRLEVQDTDFGFQYAAIRATQSPDGSRYVRITPFIMPFVAYVPPGRSVSLFIPLDDETTAWVSVQWAPTDEIFDSESHLPLLGLDDKSAFGADHVLRVPGQDRAAMASGASHTGIRGIVLQDAAVQMSMGPIVDRSREHLVPADLAVIRMRRCLLDSARAVARGGVPIGLERSVSTDKIEGAAGVIDAGRSWSDLVAGNVVVERPR